MKKTTKLKSLIEADDILVMPGAFDGISAKLIEQADFQAVQCTGASIVAVHLGAADYGVIGLGEMVNITRLIARAVDIPVMGDADTGFGNAVNTFLAVEAFEAAGAAGINIEDQVMPKRCGHLDGKAVEPIEEATTKIQAAADARRDPDFVINARTDALATGGVTEVIKRGNAYLRAGATMVFVEGAHSTEVIAQAVAGIDGPVGVNMVEGGKTPEGLTFSDLEAMGVARVSLPGTLLLSSVKAMQDSLQRVRQTGGIDGNADYVAGFNEVHSLSGMGRVNALETKYLR